MIDMKKKIDSILNQLIAGEINKNEAVQRISSIMSAIKLPDLSSFKGMRDQLGLSLRDVAHGSKMSAATISRIERSRDCEYSNVVALFDFYNMISLPKSKKK